MADADATHPAPLRVSEDDLDDEDLDDAQTAIAETFARDLAGPVAVLDGYGVSMRTDSGRLVLSDGMVDARRTRHFSRATHGLARVVVMGHSGQISLDALRWCDHLGIPVVILDQSVVRATFASIPRGTGDARLRRAQAAAPDSAVGLEITRDLLRAKLGGQESVLRSLFKADEVADTISDLADALAHVESVDEARQLEAAAAAAAFGIWTGHEVTVPRFASRDLRRVPDHWLRFDGRRSVLTTSNSNHRAERPLNAMLNYLFSLVEVEACLACHRVGLDAGLGIAHLDVKGRSSSMALDLAEPVRPAAELWLLTFMQRRNFRRSDFVETADGHVRIMSPLSHELAETMPLWAEKVGPWAERVAHLLGQVIAGKYQPVTPITRVNSKKAAAAVKARKAAVYAGVASRRNDRAKRQRAHAQPTLPFSTCATCGGRLERERHKRCPTCWAFQPGQTKETRARRGRAIATTRAELECWKVEHPDAVADPDRFAEAILPGLVKVKLSEIMAACGVAKSTASMIRSGRHVPALRHWAALADLSESS